MSHYDGHATGQQQQSVDYGDVEIQVARRITPAVAAQPQYYIRGDQAAKNRYF
jgi:hypothetical protein